MKDWIQTYTGKQVFPLDLHPEVVCIEDIAHALAMKCRFTGHTRCHYSVAQHCVTGAKLIDPLFALPFLLHEVSEVYLPDIAAPLKPFVFVQQGGRPISWKSLEGQHTETVCKALGLDRLLPLITSDEVKRMDQRMLATEARAFLGTPPAPWDLDAEPFYFLLSQQDPCDAEQDFLELFYRLTGKDPQQSFELEG